MTRTILFALCTFVGSAGAKETTFRIALAFGNDDITFDLTRASRAEVDRWIRLSPYVGVENNYLRPEIFDQVMGHDPREVGCGSQGRVSPLNGQLLDRISERIRSLDPHQYPADLSKVVLYLRRVQSFGLWTNRQLLSFVKSCDLSALKSEFDGVNPKVECGAALNRIAKAKDGPEAFRARSDWESCVWRAEMKQIGEYPKDAWSCFLAAHGIREHFIPDEGID